MQPLSHGKHIGLPLPLGDRASVGASQGWGEGRSDQRRAVSVARLAVVSGAGSNRAMQSATDRSPRPTAHRSAQRALGLSPSPVRGTACVSRSEAMETQAGGAVAGHAPRTTHADTNRQPGANPTR